MRTRRTGTLCDPFAIRHQFVLESFNETLPSRTESSHYLLVTTYLAMELLLPLGLPENRINA